MIAVYKRYNYNLIELPKIGITDRANFIINKI